MAQGTSQYNWITVAPTASINGVDPRLLAGLNAVGQALGKKIEVFSGYRSPTYSAKVGGYSNDPHSRGEAVDARIDGQLIGDVVPLSTLQKYGLEGGNTPNFYRGNPDPEHVQIPGSGVNKGLRSPDLGGATGVASQGNLPPSGLASQPSAAPSATPTAATGGDSRLSLLYSMLAKHPHLDPQAVLAVASTEGLDGGIGDGGHAFGPFQLNNAGGVYPSQAPQDPQAANQWAWSKQGINYALNGIKDVAAGLKGPDAIRAIVGNKQIGGSYGGFERPADEGGEITKALGRYGHMPTITPGAPLPAGPPVSRGLPQAPAGTSSLPPSIVAQLASRQPVRPQLAPNLVLALGKLLGGLK